MKDEEMAEEYEATKHYRYEDNDYCGDIADGIKQAFLAGLKAGRPQWHKMDYNDKKSYKNIPRYTELLTMYSCGLFEAHCINKWTGDHWCEHSYGIIAWCEIPTFDKE